MSFTEAWAFGVKRGERIDQYLRKYMTLILSNVEFNFSQKLCALIPPKSSSWSRLLKPVFRVDVSLCPGFGHNPKIASVVTDGEGERFLVLASQGIGKVRKKPAHRGQ